MAAAAALMICVAPTSGQASEGPMVVAFFNQEKAISSPDVTGAIPRGLNAAKGDSKSDSKGGGIEKQVGSVSTACLKPELTRIIRNASSHFGETAVITSGYRRSRHSYHGRCMAADVQVPGVSPASLAKFFRAQPGVGGVGTYGHTRSVHVDVAPRQYTWHHGGRRKRYA